MLVFVTVISFVAFNGVSVESSDDLFKMLTEEKSESFRTQR